MKLSVLSGSTQVLYKLQLLTYSPQNNLNNLLLNYFPILLIKLDLKAEKTHRVSFTLFITVFVARERRIPLF